MMMSEAERQYYLGKAGINLWYARAPLPGAAPSPEFTFPVEESASESESDPIVARHPRPARSRPAGDGAGKHRIAGIQALMADSAAEAPAAQSDVEAVGQPTPSAEEQPSVDLPAAQESAPESGQQVQVDARLGFWVSERMVLVSGISDEASVRLQEALAENILAALGESVVEESRHIRWPVFGNPRVPGNSVDDLHSVLRSVSKEFGARKLLLLGVLVDDLFPDRSDWLDSALGTCAVDFPQSLAGLAAAPAHKRELWRQLKSAVGV